MSRIITVTGLAFGDETKGATVDFFARQMVSSLVVRYNGGAQAAHNVVTPDDIRHCFAQFGSGTFTSGSRTFLSREMLIEPRNLLVEEEYLQKAGVTDALTRLVVSPEATVITPFHKMVCQLKELGRGRKRFGSCGMGIGETVLDRNNDVGIKVGDFANPIVLRQKLNEIAGRRFAEAHNLYRQNPNGRLQERLDYFEATAEVEELIQPYQNFAARVTIADTAIREALAADVPIIFEGAQGALLDRMFGFRPYVSKTTCTYHNAQDLLSEAAGETPVAMERIGLLRAYSHRHGAGPLPTEDRQLAGFLVDQYNRRNPWQGKFRFGWFDAVLARYGIAINDGVDYLGLNCLDQLTGIPTLKIVTSYLYRGPLDVLEGCCEWEQLGKNQAIIREIHKPEPGFNQEVLTVILAHSKPRDFLELPGWNKDLTSIHSWEDLPSTAREYVRTIGQLLGVRIRLVSVNPKATGRLLLNS